MQLTHFTDYSLRVVLYLAVKKESASVSEIANYYGISRHHMVKVVHNLAKLNLVKTTRGKGGGVTLAMAPEDVNIGEVVDKTEPNFHLVGCFDPACNKCPILPGCLLRNVLEEALQNFKATLARYTLADLLRDEKLLQELIQRAA